MFCIEAKSTGIFSDGTVAHLGWKGAIDFLNSDYGITFSTASLFWGEALYGGVGDDEFP
jgi:hypothetical protein